MKGNLVLAPVDAAWIFEGTQLVSSAPWPFEPLMAVAYTNTSALAQYQLDGMRFLASRDWALLADEMGLGKTAQALCAAQARLGTARGAAYHTPHVLILCPALAKRHWAREVEKWTGCEAQILDGLKPGELSVRARFVIANYDILAGARRRDAAGKMHEVEHLAGWKGVLSEYGFPIVIVDEAHNLRGEKSKRTQAVKQVCKRSTCVWLLTGTPMPNHVRDLWSLWDLASDGLAGWFWPWAKAYAGAVQGPYGWSADGQSKLDELSQRCSFWMLGRTKAAVALQLPEKRRETVTVDVGDAATVQRRFVEESAPILAHQPNAAGKTNIVATALRLTAEAKRPAVVEMAAEALAAGQKVVVFVYMRETVEKIAGELAARTVKGLKARIIPVHGGASPEARDAAAGQFRASTEPAVFIATIDSAGTAISLVGADLVIFGDLSWEPAKLLQAEGRAHRYGSTTRVLIRYVLAAGTIDEHVQEAVIEKFAAVESAIGGMGDGKELTVALGRDMSSSAEILDRLFNSLIGGGR